MLTSTTKPIPNWLPLVSGSLCLVGLIWALTSLSQNPVALPAPTPIVISEQTATPDPQSPAPTSTPTQTPSPTLEQARSAYLAHNYKSAITSFVEVLAASGDTDKAGIENELGMAYRDDGQTELALTAFSNAYTKDSHLIAAYQNAANLNLALGKRGAAQTVLELGLTANPNNLDLQRDLSLVNLSGPGE